MVKHKDFTAPHFCDNDCVRMNMIMNILSKNKTTAEYYNSDI